MKKMLKLGLALGLVIALLIPGGMALAAHSETFAFPSPGSTVVGSVGFIDGDEIGWFWSVARGDTVSETLSSSLPTIGGAILDVELVDNVLNSGAYVDWDVKINGVLVDSFTVNEGFTGPIHREMSFAPIAGPDYLVELVVTNEVAGGEGSHSLAYAGAHAHSIELISRAPKVKVTGGGTVDWGAGRVTYGFTAEQVDAGGAAKGEAQFQHRDTRVRDHADVLYLAVSGGDAWIGAVITQSDDPTLVGQEIYFRVQDNGEGKKATGPDMVSSVVLGPAITALCMPALESIPWTNGNVQVKQLKTSARR
jgi:hypothetical protein